MMFKRAGRETHDHYINDAYNIHESYVRKLQKHAYQVAHQASSKETKCACQVTTSVTFSHQSRAFGGQEHGEPDAEDHA